MAVDDTPPLTPPAIPVSTTFEIDGKSGTYVAPAYGIVVRSMGFSRNLVGGIKSFKRGDVTEFSGTLEEARDHAIARMVEHAQGMGGNAVVGLRFDSAPVDEGGLTEIVAYGTAVTL